MVALLEQRGGHQPRSSTAGRSGSLAAASAATECLALQSLYRGGVPTPCRTHLRPILQACDHHRLPGTAVAKQDIGFCFIRTQTLENSAMVVAPLSSHSQWGTDTHTPGAHKHFLHLAVLGARVGPATACPNCQITVDTINHTPGSLGWGWSRGMSERLGLYLILTDNPVSILDPGT